MKEKIQNIFRKLFQEKGFSRSEATNITFGIMDEIHDNIYNDPQRLKDRLNEISIVCGQAANMIPPFKT